MAPEALSIFTALVEKKVILIAIFAPTHARVEIFQPVGADDASKHVPLVIEILSCLYVDTASFLVSLN